MANGITSQWEDIHVKMGNYVPREKEPDQKDLNLKTQELMDQFGQPFSD